jgi:TonB family protein
MRWYFVAVAVLIAVGQSMTVCEAKPSSASDRAMLEYGRYVAARLAAIKITSLMRGHAGVVFVRFEIGKWGNLLGRRIETSSNDPYLDAAALAIIDRLAPFKPLPDGAEGNAKMRLPIRFGGH